MATNSNIEILDYDPFQVMQVNIASATVLAVGDLVDLSGTTDGVGVANSGANATFLGVAMEGSASGEIKPISIARRCWIRAKVATTAATIGKSYTYSTGANGTDWSFAPATAEGMMWAEEEIAVGSYGKFYVDTNTRGGFLYEQQTT